MTTSIYTSNCIPFPVDYKSARNAAKKCEFTSDLDTSEPSTPVTRRTMKRRRNDESPSTSSHNRHEDIKIIGAKTGKYQEPSPLPLEHPGGTLNT